MPRAGARLVAEQPNHGHGDVGRPHGDHAVGVAQALHAVPGVVPHGVAGPQLRAVLRHDLPRARVLRGACRLGSSSTTPACRKRLMPVACIAGARSQHRCETSFDHALVTYTLPCMSSCLPSIHNLTAAAFQCTKHRAVVNICCHGPAACAHLHRCRAGAPDTAAPRPPRRMSAGSGTAESPDAWQPCAPAQHAPDLSAQGLSLLEISETSRIATSPLMHDAMRL